MNSMEREPISTDRDDEIITDEEHEAMKSEAEETRGELEREQKAEDKEHKHKWEDAGESHIKGFEGKQTFDCTCGAIMFEDYFEREKLGVVKNE